MQYWVSMWGGTMMCRTYSNILKKYQNLQQQSTTNSLEHFLKVFLELFKGFARKKAYLYERLLFQAMLKLEIQSCTISLMEWGQRRHRSSAFMSRLKISRRCHYLIFFFLIPGANMKIQHAIKWSHIRFHLAQHSRWGLDKSTDLCKDTSNKQASRAKATKHLMIQLKTCMMPTASYGVLFYISCQEEPLDYK